MRKTLLLAAAALILVSGFCLAARKIEKKDEEPSAEEVLQANRKKLLDVRLKFMEQYRKARKPKEGPGRIVGFAVNKADYSGLKKVAIKASMIKNAKGKKAEVMPSYEEVSGKSGVYEIEDMVPGSYSVEAEMEGYTAYKRRSVYVRPGTASGLGTWLVVEMKKIVVQKGEAVGTVKHIEPTYKNIKIVVTETSEEWEDLIKKKIVFHSAADDAVMRSLKTLKSGDTVEFSFVKRSGRYVLIGVQKK